jgi:hypothetical protein
VCSFQPDNSDPELGTHFDRRHQQSFCMLSEISQLHFPQSSQAEGKARRKHRHHGDFGSVIVNQDNSFSETNSQAVHRQLQPNHVRLMYQNLHFVPEARFYVGLKTCMAQLAGLAKPSSLTVMHVCTIDHVARMLGEAPGLLEAIIYNDNNLSKRVTIRRRPRLCGFDDQTALPVPGKEFWQA